jgi:hypothetical protein
VEGIGNEYSVSIEISERIIYHYFYLTLFLSQRRMSSNATSAGQALSEGKGNEEEDLVPRNLGKLGQLLFRRSVSQDEEEYYGEDYDDGDDYYWDEYDNYGESFERGMFGSGGGGGGGGGKKKKQSSGQVYSQKHIRQLESRRNSNKPKKKKAEQKKT